MTIYLAPEVRSGLGEDTVWEFLHRELPPPLSTFDAPPAKLAPGDSLMQYATLGPPPPGCRDGAIACCWELYHEMRDQLGSNAWAARIAGMEACAAACRRRTVATPLAVPYFEPFGPVDVIPIGVDTDLFKPLDRRECRDKHSIPQDRRVGFWCGTNHRMKGFDLLLEYAARHPDVYWVIVWKSKREVSRDAGSLPRTEFIHVTQPTMAELMNAADFVCMPGRLRPFFITEWEAMACNLPAVIVGEARKDFQPSDNPRDDVFNHGWSRKQSREAWAEYFGEGVEQ